jgi:hypothetical protein
MLRHILSYDPAKVYSQSTQSLLPTNLAKSTPHLCTMLSYLPGSEPVLLNYTPTGQLVPSLALDLLTKSSHAVRRDEGHIRVRHPQGLTPPLWDGSYPWPDSLRRDAASYLQEARDVLMASGLTAARVASVFCDPLYRSSPRKSTRGFDSPAPIFSRSLPTPGIHASNARRGLLQALTCSRICTGERAAGRSSALCW